MLKVITIFLRITHKFVTPSHGQIWVFMQRVYSIMRWKFFVARSNKIASNSAVTSLCFSKNFRRASRGFVLWQTNWKLWQTNWKAVFRRNWKCSCYGLLKV